MNPHTLGRFEIRHELGRGGMAIVYLGYDPRIEREVAIKVLPRQFSFDPQFEIRFQREVRAIAKLEHGAIVPVYDFGEVDDQPFIVMRYMSGGSLAARLRAGHLSLPEVARILTRIAPALDRAHAQGIIHRDLKPGNILFDQEGEAYLSDFGIAKLADATAAYTGSALIGTPAYMSPEQARGEANIDGRSDVYSLGVILFETLAGRPPYAADTPMGIAMRHLTDPIPRIRTLNPRLPKQVERMFRQALAKSPGDRFQSAAELAEALAGIKPQIPHSAVRWAPAVLSNTLAGRPESVSPTVQPPGTGETAGRDPVPTVVDRPTVLGGRLRRVPRTALLASGVLGLLIVGAAFAAGVDGGGSPTPTPTATATQSPTQAPAIIPTLAPSNTPSLTPTPTVTASPTPSRVTPLPTETERPAPLATPPPTPAPTLPPTVTPAPPATSTEVPPPTLECTPPEILCEQF